MQPTAILLDLGGVVFQSTGQSNATINWEVISALNYRYGHDLNIGQDLFSEFMSSYNQRTGQSLVGAEFLKAIFDTLIFNADLVEYLGKIAPIIIVSDNYRENIEYISERYRFKDWASREIYSFDYELEKADHAFFPKLLTEIDIPAEDLLFIDDSPHKLASAARVGIPGIRFQNNAQLMVEVDAFFGRV